MDNQLLFVIFLISGYLLGSIPFGYLISKTKQIDIRKIGSGATGATNVSRALGFKYAILVATLDIAKALITIYIASFYFQPGWQLVLISIAPVIGHIFPIWLKFKGGKGVSVIFASIIFIIGWKYSLILFLVWILALSLIKIMSLTNLIACLVLPFLFWLKTKDYPYSYIYVLLGIFYILVIWFAHRENIKRLRQGTEPKIIKK